MQLEMWFPQPIWFKDYEVDFSEAIAYIEELKKINPGRQFSNMGGWQSEDVGIEAIKELKEPFNIILSGVEYVTQDLQQYGFNKLCLSNAWINVNKGTDYNREHVHPLSTFSGCLYLKASTAAGAIEFKRPDSMELYPGVDNKTGIFYPSSNYKPSIGRLLIFPAWLPHMALPSEDVEERISIAFNLIHEEQ
jgi:uncharacterized protein (TIGR02466 family)